MFPPRPPLKLTGIAGFDWRAMLETVAKHMFTAADGETYAIGRLLGVVLFAFGLLAPTAGVIYFLFAAPPTWAEFMALLDKAGVYLGLLVASVVGLITLTNPTEPKPATAQVTTTDGNTTVTASTDPAPPVQDEPAPRV